MSYLEVNNIEVVYHDIVQVLRGVNLKAEEGKILALLGTNGAGKTTSLRSLTGLLKPENGKIISGSVLFQGKNITDMPGNRIVKEGLVMVPEGRRVFKHLTVEENIKVGAYTRKDSASKIREDEERMYEMFPKLKQLKNKSAGYCSGGEQQMIAISRALMTAPKLLMLDEPSLGLAPLLVAEIMEVIHKLNKENGLTILLVEQNANAALRIADYAYIMESGKIVLQGTASELKNNPDVKEFYMGMTRHDTKKSFKNIKSYKRRKRWM